MAVHIIDSEEKKYRDFMERIENGEKIEVDDWMPDEYRNVLIRLISMHGISEIMGAFPEKEWTPKAPSLYRKLGIMAKVQDEVGHGQLLLRVAEDLAKPLGKNREDLINDLFDGKLRFHNVFHWKTKSWADAGLIGWLVDGAAIITQTNMLDCSYAPYGRALKRIAAEEVFHAQHGEAISVALAQGTEQQKAMLQDALNRWWPALLMFFGPPNKAVTGSSKEELTIKYRIRKNTNEDLRQFYLTKYVPRIQGLGLTIPDETLRFDEETGNWVYKQPDWNWFKEIINNNGPMSKERLRLRKISYEFNSWVREALAAE